MRKPRTVPASKSWSVTGNPPERCEPWLPWKSFLPRGRSEGITCSRSGAEAAMAPQGRRIEQAAARGKERGFGYAAPDLEAAALDVLVRDAV
jgi:hypothetical protein